MMKQKKNLKNDQKRKQIIREKRDDEAKWKVCKADEERMKTK